MERDGRIRERRRMKERTWKKGGREEKRKARISVYHGNAAAYLQDSPTPPHSRLTSSLRNIMQNITETRDRKVRRLEPKLI